MKRFSIIILTFIIGCNTTKIAEKKIKSAYKHHPEVVAKFLNDSLPCVTTKVDTIVTTELEYITIKCPDWFDMPMDTQWLTSSKTQLIEGPGVIAYEKKYITIQKSIKDSAEVIKYKLQLKSCDEEYKKVVSNNHKLTMKVEKKNKWLMWLVILLMASIIFNLLLFKK